MILFAIFAKKSKYQKQLYEKEDLLYCPCICHCGIIFAAFGNPYNPDHSDGAPAGYTGSPGDVKIVRTVMEVTPLHKPESSPPIFPARVILPEVLIRHGKPDRFRE